MSAHASKDNARAVAIEFAIERGVESHLASASRTPLRGSQTMSVDGY